MLDLKTLAQNYDEVVAKLKRRGGTLDLGPVAKLIAERLELIKSVEALRQKQNAANEEIKAKAKTDPGAIEKLRGDLRAVSQEAKQKDEKLREVEAELEKILLYVPNLPHESVPDGKPRGGQPGGPQRGREAELNFTPKAHWELGEALGILDFERAAKDQRAALRRSTGAPGAGWSGR